MDTSIYYDKQGMPITQKQWLNNFKKGNKKIGFDKIGKQEVSTVLVGLNMSTEIEAPPLIFETMIFGGEYDQAQWRYYTEEQAKFWHNRIVQALKNGHNPRH